MARLSLTGLDPQTSAIIGTFQLLDADVTFQPGVAGFDGGSLLVSGALAGDIVSIRDIGTGAGEIGYVNGHVTYGGVDIGTATGGTGTAFTVSFNAGCSAAAIQELIENLTYSAGIPGPTTIRVIVTDQSGATTADPAFIEVAPADSPLRAIDFVNPTDPTVYLGTAIGDINGDGLNDLVVATNISNFFDPEGVEVAPLHYFQNTGTSTSPVFSEIKGVIPGSAELVAPFVHPVLADLNNDGRLDIVVNQDAFAFSSIHLAYVSNGTSFVELPYDPFAAVHDPMMFGVGSLDATFADLNNDGKLDLILPVVTPSIFDPNAVMNLTYWTNVGTNQAPLFQAGTTSLLIGVGDLPASIVTSPVIKDLDGDGSADLLLIAGGTLHYFELGDTVFGPTFLEKVGGENPFSGIDVSTAVSFSVGDLNGDGKPDIIIGEANAQLRYLENVQESGEIVVNAVKNNAPTLVAFENAVLTIAENAPTIQRVLVADIAVTDDGYGSTSLTLTGDDAISFEIVGSQLFLKAGTTLDFETKATYRVAVEADDLTVGASPDATSSILTLALADLNEAPTGISLVNITTSIVENASTITHIKVADIIVSDDALGTNALTLTGDDPSYFEIVGTELFLKAGTVLDFETKTNYQVAVVVDDATGGSTPDATSSTFTLNVSNVSPEVLVGDAGSNILTGGSDNDLIFGLAGKDNLSGGDGDDVITGGTGKDALTGGFGADVFDFNFSRDSVKASSNRDVITDFTHLIDHINVHDIDANNQAGGNQNFKFIKTAAFHHKAGELHIKYIGALKTLVEGDTNGDGKADFQIELSGHIGLTKGDFIL